MVRFLIACRADTQKFLTGNHDRFCARRIRRAGFYLRSRGGGRGGGPNAARPQTQPHPSHPPTLTYTRYLLDKINQLPAPQKRALPQNLKRLTGSDQRSDARCASGAYYGECPATSYLNRKPLIAVKRAQYRETYRMRRRYDNSGHSPLFPGVRDYDCWATGEIRSMFRSLR